MQDINDDERKLILSELMTDQLKLILEYVKDVPIIKKELREMRTKIDNNDDRLSILEYIVKEHDKDIKMLKLKIA